MLVRSDPLSVLPGNNNATLEMGTCIEDVVNIKVHVACPSACLLALVLLGKKAPTPCCLYVLASQD